MNVRAEPGHDTEPNALSAPHYDEQWRRIEALAGADGAIEGAYRLIRPLGAGAMGMVALCTDLRLQRPVAIKFAHAQLLTFEGMRERFVAEARTMAKIDHPNVVSVFDYGEVMDTPYFVMEYVDGSSLERELVREGAKPMAVDEVLRLLRQIASGVEAIHRVGAIHRDLKPGNVLLAPGSRAVITDFGLARSLDLVRQGGVRAVGGTPAYMAPEVALGYEATAQTDVYSLAVLTFELLCGRLPFTGDRSRQIVKQHIQKRPPHPSDVRPSLPQGLGDAVVAALAKDPAARPATPTAFVAALAAARAGAQLDTQVRIYVADDDPDMRRLVSVVLQEGYPNAEIALFENGAAALAALRDRPPTLAIIDFQMPVLDGPALLTEIRANEATLSTPVIIMTAVGGAQDWQRLRKLGASAFLAKPFEPSGLLSTVERLLGAAYRDAQSPAG